MNKHDLQEKIRKFCIRILKMAGNLPETKTGTIIAGQIIRSATSIGANYRAACRSKSAKDFINKLKIAEEESDETMYWLELIKSSEILDHAELTSLIREANELVAIFVSSIRTAKTNQKIETQPALQKSKV